MLRIGNAQPGQVRMSVWRPQPVNVGAMPRSARNAPGGMVFHCINRGVGDNRPFS